MGKRKPKDTRQYVIKDNVKYLPDRDFHNPIYGAIEQQAVAHARELKKQGFKTFYKKVGNIFRVFKEVKETADEN